MKRALVLLLCVTGLILLTAPTAVEHSQLTINGNRLGNIVVGEGGVWLVALEDVSRAFGSSVSLEPALQLQGNRLMVREAALEYMKIKEGTLVPAVNKSETTMKIKAAPGQFLKVQKAGAISSHVVMLNGKAYVPVRDLVRAFGDSSVQGSFTGPLQPGGLNLHINGNNNGIIAILVGL
jgi:hypothetical protein